MRKKLVSMVATHACVMVLAAAYLLMSTPSHARVRASFPDELHGFWIPEGGDCPEQGQSYDGDQVLDITAGQLLGYEETSKPTKVALLSKAPKAWRVESLIDIGPSGIYERAGPMIFVLSKWTLTVVDDNNATVFKRCQVEP